jgi:hypothetical protein
MKYWTFKAMVAFSTALTLSASADVRTHFGDGVGADVIPNLLDRVGIGRTNSASENAASVFDVPGAPGSSIDVSFQFEWDTGTFQFAFGFFSLSKITANPVTERNIWVKQALNASNATLVFDDRVVDPITRSGKFRLMGGDRLGFFLIPNNTLAAFQSTPDLFLANPDGLGNSGDFFDPFRAPLFSVSDVNPRQFDQMLSFAGNGVTMFAFEDLVRTGFTDEQFNDLVFTIDTEIVPAPQSLAAAGAAGLLLLRRRRI